MIATDVAPKPLSERLTISEAAAYLRVSTSTVRRRYRNGRLRGYKDEGILRFKLSDLEAFFDGGLVEQPAPAPKVDPLAPTALSQARSRGRAA